MDLSAIKHAAQIALSKEGVTDAAEIVLAAASALPPNASDFDCGMAAGFAVAKLLERHPSEIEKEIPLAAIFE